MAVEIFPAHGEMQEWEDSLSKRYEVSFRPCSQVHCFLFNVSSSEAAGSTLLAVTGKKISENSNYSVFSIQWENNNLKIKVLKNAALYLNRLLS